MRRFIALCLIAAFISVSSLPLLPTDQTYAHATERMMNNHKCHKMPMMNQSGHIHGALSRGMRNCRIECGGQRSLNQLPHQFSPHVVVNAVEPAFPIRDPGRARIPPVFDLFSLIVPIPPPELISTLS